MIVAYVKEARLAYAQFVWLLGTVASIAFDAEIACLVLVK
jgi:hypothetical protein